jgi:hypothetical protein
MLLYTVGATVTYYPVAKFNELSFHCKAYALGMDPKISQQLTPTIELPEPLVLIVIYCFRVLTAFGSV